MPAVLADPAGPAGEPGPSAQQRQEARRALRSFFEIHHDELSTLGAQLAFGRVYGRSGYFRPEEYLSFAYVRIAARLESSPSPEALVERLADCLQVRYVYVAMRNSARHLFAQLKTDVPVWEALPEHDVTEVPTVVNGDSDTLAVIVSTLRERAVRQRPAATALSELHVRCWLAVLSNDRGAQSQLARDLGVDRSRITQIKRSGRAKVLETLYLAGILGPPGALKSSEEIHRCLDAFEEAGPDTAGGTDPAGGPGPLTPIQRAHLQTAALAVTVREQHGQRADHRAAAQLHLKRRDHAGLRADIDEGEVELDDYLNAFATVLHGAESRHAERLEHSYPNCTLNCDDHNPVHDRVVWEVELELTNDHLRGLSDLDDPLYADEWDEISIGDGDLDPTLSGVGASGLSLFADARDAFDAAIYVHLHRYAADPIPSERDQAGADQADPDQAGPDQAGADQAGATQFDLGALDLAVGARDGFTREQAEFVTDTPRLLDHLRLLWLLEPPSPAVLAAASLPTPRGLVHRALLNATGYGALLSPTTGPVVLTLVSQTEPTMAGDYADPTVSILPVEHAADLRTSATVEAPEAVEVTAAPEPTQTEPTQTEPTQTEPTQTEPTQTDPARRARRVRARRGQPGPHRRPGRGGVRGGLDAPPVHPQRGTGPHRRSRAARRADRVTGPPRARRVGIAGRSGARAGGARLRHLPRHGHQAARRGGLAQPEHLRRTHLLGQRIGLSPTSARLRPGQLRPHRQARLRARRSGRRLGRVGSG